MPMTQRGWSIKSFALSKVCLRGKCVELRVCDIKKLTNVCKSWLYQDMLVKPEEIILHRPHQYGGLGCTLKYKGISPPSVKLLPTQSFSLTSSIPCSLGNMSLLNKIPQ